MQFNQINTNRSNISQQGFQTNNNTNITNPALEMQLKNYIQTQLNHGYNIEVIKNALFRQGFNPNIVNKVTNDLNNVNINVKHEVNISRGTIIGISAAIIIIGIIVFGVINFSIFKPKDSLMDITITNTAYSYLPGETINFQIYVTNMGSTQKFDYTIKYLVVDDTGKVITRKEETLAVQTTASVNRNIQLPKSILPGKYYLQAISDYGNKQAKSVSEFEVVQKVEEKKPATYVPPVITTPQTNTNTDQNTNNNPGTNPNNNDQNTNTPTTNTGKTFGEVLTEVKQSAQTNPELAATSCSKLVSIEQKDICYSTVADNSNLYAYCDRITGVDYRDNCYLAFVMNKGNLDICNKITDNSSKSLCDQLRIIKLMDKYYAENNTEMMLELNNQFNPAIIQNTNPQVKTYEYTYTEPVTIMDIVSTAPVTETPPTINTSNGTS